MSCRWRVAISVSTRTPNYSYPGIPGAGVTRLRFNGTRDLSYGHRGIAAIDDTGVDSLVGIGDDALFIADRPTNDPNFVGTRLRRFTASGQLDTTCGDDGELLIPRIGHDKPGPQADGQYNDRL